MQPWLCRKNARETELPHYSVEFEMFVLANKIIWITSTQRWLKWKENANPHVSQPVILQNETASGFVIVTIPLVLLNPKSMLIKIHIKMHTRAKKTCSCMQQSILTKVNPAKECSCTNPIKLTMSRMTVGFFFTRLTMSF